MVGGRLGAAMKSDGGRRRRRRAASTWRRGQREEIPSAGDFDGMGTQAKAKSLLATDSFRGAAAAAKGAGGRRGGRARLAAPAADGRGGGVGRCSSLAPCGMATGGPPGARGEAQQPQPRAEALLEAERSGADDATVAALRQEVNLQTSLRADFTQDEGDYSRFLDKDDWYERDRRRAMGLDRPD